MILGKGLDKTESHLANQITIKTTEKKQNVSYSKY